MARADDCDRTVQDLTPNFQIYVSRGTGHGGATTTHLAGTHSSLGSGAQYSCVAYQLQLTTLGITPSMSRKGNCYDNAVAESFFSTLKNELVHHQTYHTREEASREIFVFMEEFYNRQRLHQSLGYLSPLEFERRIEGA